MTLTKEFEDRCEEELEMWKKTHPIAVMTPGRSTILEDYDSKH